MWLPIGWFSLCIVVVVRIYLDLVVMQKSSAYRLSSIPEFKHLVMLLIFRLKRVLESILLWGTPSCWLWRFDSVEPIRIYCPRRNSWSNWVICLLAPSCVGLSLWHIFKWSLIPYLSRNNYEMLIWDNCFSNKVSKLNTWSIVDVWLLKPYLELVISYWILCIKAIFSRHYALWFGRGKSFVLLGASFLDSRWF